MNICILTESSLTAILNALTYQKGLGRFLAGGKYVLVISSNKKMSLILYLESLQHDELLSRKSNKSQIPDT